MDTIAGIPLLMHILAAFAGYLCGSISNARIITLILTKSINIKGIKAEVPGSDQTFESDSISATVVSQNHGKGYGCLTSLLDMFKVACPTFLVQYFFPEQPYFLITALGGILGHNYTLYHRFRGGRGESPIIGAMLVINWWGIFIANVASMILGWFTRSVLVMRYGWYVLMIFWYWIYFESILYVGFMILANFLFWFSMRKDLGRYAELKQEYDLDIPEEEVSEFLMMGRGPGRFLDRYSLPSLIRKLFTASSGKDQNS
jgi:glycerol-3-phosphate acyltransferase PlsY